MGFKSRVDLGSGVLLHSRQDVRVQIERDPDLAVPESLARHLHMYAGAEHVRRV